LQDKEIAWGQQNYTTGGGTSRDNVDDGSYKTGHHR